MDGGVIVNDHHAQLWVGWRVEKREGGEDFAFNVGTTLILDSL